METNSKSILNCDLSFEEELEIIESLYILGHVKDFNFVSDEQKQILLDNGRIIINPETNLEEFPNLKNPPIISNNAERMADIFTFLLDQSFTKYTIEKLKYCTQEEWDIKKYDAKDAILNFAFFLEYEMERENMRQQMIYVFSGKKLEK